MCLLVVLEAKVCNEGVGRDVPPAFPATHKYILYTHTHTYTVGARGALGSMTHLDGSHVAVINRAVVHIAVL